MKSTGVVRKIDHLGRIVIPKEIRKNLKIRDGENLEIYVEGETILLEKASSMNGFHELSQSFVEIVSTLTNKSILITDMNCVIAIDRNTDAFYLNADLSSHYLSILEKRDVFVANAKAKISVIENQEEDVFYLLMPIVVHGELMGSILLFSASEPITDTDKTILRVILKILEKNIE